MVKNPDFDHLKHLMQPVLKAQQGSGTRNRQFTRQELQEMESLVVASGGSRGFFYPGAMLRLHEEGVRFKNVAGSSAGGMMALTYGMGYRSKQDYGPILLDYDFGDFTNVDGKMLKSLPRNLKDDGIFSAKEIGEWGAYTIARRTGNPDLTFAEQKAWIEAARREDLAFFEQKLHTAQAKRDELCAQFANQEQGFDFDFKSASDLMQNAKNMAQIHLGLTEVSKDPDKALKKAEEEAKRKLTVKEQANYLIEKEIYKPFYANAENAPNVKIADAMEASASIPYIFEREEIVVKGEKNGYWDGGIQAPLPFKALHQDGLPDEKTFVLSNHRGGDYQEKTSLLEKLGRKIFTLKSPSIPATEYLATHAEQAIESHPKVQHQMFSVDTGLEGSTNFKKPREEKEAMWDEAYQQMDAGISRGQHQYIAQKRSSGSHGKGGIG